MAATTYTHTALAMSFDTPYPLTPAQAASFASDGFLILTDVLSQPEVADLQAWAGEVQTWPSRRGQHMPYTEVRADGSVGLCRTENYANYHAGFGGLFRGQRLTGILSELMGEPAVLFKEKINYKEPGGSGGFDAHIDASAYNHAGAVKHTTFLMAVDAMDLANGCLEVVVGSHRETIPLAANRCIDPEWEKNATWTPVPLPAGALLVFGSYLAHRSGPNSSPRARAAIYATYNGISEGDKHDAYYAHRRAAWPPSDERVPGVDYTEGALTYAYGSPMTGGTALIDAKLAADKVDGVMRLMEAQGEADYIGERISQLQHALQAAHAAQAAGADEPTVVAALLHDIGQFVRSGEVMLVDGASVGNKAHEELGAAYLASLGFPAAVTDLVGAHVVAKRYLTATRAGYLASLSTASKLSLQCQGGPFTPAEVEQFEADPLGQKKVALRIWDDEAKVVGLDVPGLESYREMMVRVLASK
ncbi:hypothetical protein Q8F55_007231 [Vanrija albida]|uniref:HD domain-containing protein n=1 Tax=Vanrija albida TaxID=181172 RepID=A0ABR3PZC5_9TREE